MNLIQGRLQRSAERCRVQTADGIELPLPTGVNGSDGQEVYYGVRPDHLGFGDRMGIDAIVGVVEPTGANTLVFATIGNQKVCASFSERYNFRPGDRIGLVPRLDCVHLFDRQSGINLMP